MKVVTRKKVTVSKVEGQQRQLEARGPAVAAEIEVAQPGAEIGRRRLLVRRDRGRVGIVRHDPRRPARPLRDRFPLPRRAEAGKPTGVRR